MYMFIVVLSPPKSPEPSDSVLSKQYNYLDILSEEDSDIEDLCLIGGRGNIKRSVTNGNYRFVGHGLQQ